MKDLSRSDVIPANPARSPWFAVNLSLLFPGLGQLRLGQRIRGGLWLLGSLGLLGAIFWCYLAPDGNAQWGAGLLGMGVMLWLFNLIDAHACATGGWKDPASFGLLKSHPASQSLRAASKSPRTLTDDPWFGILLAQVIPGLGQLYRRQYGVAALLFVLMFASLTLLAGQLGLILGVPALAAFSVYQIAASVSSSGRAGDPKSWQRWGVEMALVVFLGRSLFFATVPMVRQVVEPFSVPSESMFPTLMVGDRILVRKQHSYRPQSGDIVVFQDPTQTAERFFVKRVVGVAGERIEVKGGKTLRNGQSINEDYINDLPRYVWDSGEILPGQVVVLGDNRNASFDSSHWGTLPVLKIVGRVYRISWPPEHARPIGRHSTEHSGGVNQSSKQRAPGSSQRSLEPLNLWSD